MTVITDVLVHYYAEIRFQLNRSEEKNATVSSEKISKVTFLLLKFLHPNSTAGFYPVLDLLDRDSDTSTPLLIDLLAH